MLAYDFAVILLDIHMPGMDGFEAAGLIRVRQKSRLTPIIFLTADDRVGAQMREAYRLGAVDYLSKPFDLDILRAKVSIFVELFRKTSALEQRTIELSVMADELKQSKVHFRELIENAPTLTLIVEASGIVRYASPSVARTLGHSGERVSGENITIFLHPDDVSSLQESAPGHRANWREVAIGDLEREAAHRKQAEETLGETEQRLRTVVHNAPLILFAVDGNGIFTVFEGLGLKALGMESGQIVGQSALLATGMPSSFATTQARLILFSAHSRARPSPPWSRRQGEFLSCTTHPS